MKSDPFYKCTLHLEALGKQLKLHVPHDVFSTERIDEGTLLLLKHLPSLEPGSVLDMGCGYGALGLPVAARYPESRIDMVDRDLLAVAWAQKNARENNLENARVFGSLGYRDLSLEAPPYDWILCNVPARIGRPFIKHLFEAGLARLSPQGELRAVVITDLAPILNEMAQENGWPLTEEGRGSRHVVFAIKAHLAHSAVMEPEDLYLRDTVEIDGMKFDRPFDLGGDDPKRLSKGLPVLLDVLPRQAPRSVLIFRSGYGQIPIIGRSRWPSAQIVAVDRDLLGSAFVSRNARKLGFAGKLLDVRERAHLVDAIQADEHFDLAICELSPSAGEKVAEAELTALARSLDRNGQALILVLEKIERQWLGGITKRKKLSMTRILAREGYALLRLTSLQ